MSFVLRFLETVDLCGFSVLGLALILVGNKLSQGNARVRAFCLSLSGLLLVAYIVFHFINGSIHSENVADLTFRGLIFSGVALGTTWILLPPIVVFFAKINDSLEKSAESARRDREDRRRRLSEEEDRRRRELAMPLAAQERERARQKAEEAERLAAEAKRLRQDARSA